MGFAAPTVQATDLMSCMERFAQLLSTSMTRSSPGEGINIQMLSPTRAALPMGARLACDQVPSAAGAIRDARPSEVGNIRLVSRAAGLIPAEGNPSEVGTTREANPSSAPLPVVALGSVGEAPLVAAASSGAKRRASVEACASDILSALQERAAESSKAKAKTKAKAKATSKDMGNAKVKATRQGTKAKGQGKSAPTLGCSKCRYLPRGCAQCRAWVAKAAGKA